jgi:predicted O-methyltransferase YrrM
MLTRIVDYIAAGVVTLGGPLFRAVGNWPGNYPRYRAQADRAGVHWRSTHYYQPTYRNADLPEEVSHERDLPGVDLNENAQVELLKQFDYGEEISSLLAVKGNDLTYSYDNNQYGRGDADSLYAMIRHLKPRRLFEIGSGNSTKMAAHAITKNTGDDPAYECDHLCIEPYEMPWLEKLGPRIIRERVEDVALALFQELEAGDVLFIDSSHVIRPFGDVLTEFQEIVPSLKPGVFVHVHDVFTPRDYPEKWLREDRRLWNEQYLLEVMLQNSQRYETVLALNWAKHNHKDEFERAFPSARSVERLEPGAYWFKVRDNA